MAERQAKSAANKAAWAAGADMRRFKKQTERNRRRGHRPRGKSMTWTQVSDWAGRGDCEGEARRLRAKLMPHWNPGDHIPLAVVKEIVRGCMRKKGEQRLARLESELQSSLPKES